METSSVLQKMNVETDEVISAAQFQIKQQEAADIRRVLIVGIQRAGTTWVAAALAATKQTIFVDEPDDERRWPQAMYAKRHLGRYPIIAPGDIGEVGGYSIDDYVSLWNAAWNAGNEFAPSNVLAKSTYLTHCLEWIVEAFPIDAVCYVERHPMNVLASWYEYGRIRHPEEDIPTAIKRMAWQFGLSHEQYARSKRMGIITAHAYHEDLCQDFALFEKLATELGLVWNYRSTDWLIDMNKAGDGGHWGLSEYRRDDHINRLAEEQTWDRWKTRLTSLVQDNFLRELEKWPTVQESFHRAWH